MANQHRKFNRTTEAGGCGRMGTAEEVTAYGPEIHYSSLGVIFLQESQVETTLLTYCLQKHK